MTEECVAVFLILPFKITLLSKMHYFYSQAMYVHLLHFHILTRTDESLLISVG